MTLATVPIVIFVDAVDGASADLSRGLRVVGSLMFDPENNEVPALLLTEHGNTAGDADSIFGVMSPAGFHKLKERIRANPESYGIEPASG